MIFFTHLSTRTALFATLAELRHMIFSHTSKSECDFLLLALRSQPWHFYHHTSQSECDFTPHASYSVERRFHTPPTQNYVREGRKFRNHSVFSIMYSKNICAMQWTFLYARPRQNNCWPSNSCQRQYHLEISANMLEPFEAMKEPGINSVTY